MSFLALLTLLSPQVSSAPAPELALVGARVLPMDSPRVLEDHTVLVRAGRIVRVGPSASVEVPPGATRIEAKGRFLVPGLCDAHVHVMDEGDLLVYLANGVTTIRNLKGLPWHVELRERIASGEVLGPRLLTSGPFVNEPQVRSVEDVQRTVAEQLEAGYDMLKIHGPLSLAAYEALLEEGALAGLPVIGHAPRNLAIEAVLERRGQLEIAHAEEYLYTYFDRLDEVDEAAIESIAKATAEAGITVTPNLVAFHSIVRQIEDLERELARPEMAFVAPPIGRSFQPDMNRYRRSFSSADAPGMAGRYALLERFTKALATAGVRLLAGSDAMNPVCVPGFSLQEELRLLVAAGLTPYEALRAATASAGAFLGDGSGVVAEGAPADLVLLAANPLEAIERAAAIEGVVVRGRWLPKEELERGLEERRELYAREQAFMGRVHPTDLGAALAFRAEARAQDPEAFLYRPEGLESLTLACATIGNGAGARALAECAVAEFPGRWTAWVRLAEACTAVEDLPAARAALARACELRPGDERLARQLAALPE
ncbi:MAG TPA: amidohydrolase family protein [Planctomycetota bacterium]